MAKKKIAQLKSDALFEYGKAEKVQQSQIFDAQGEVEDIRQGLEHLELMHKTMSADGEDIISELESFLEVVENHALPNDVAKTIECYFDEYQNSIENITSSTTYDIRKTKEILTHNNWESYFEKVTEYANGIGIDDGEDPFMSLLGEQEYKKLEEEIDGEFAKKTSLKNKTDLKFLAIAIALEVAKGLLFPIVAEKMEYGDSFNPDDRLAHDDKSIKDAQKKATDKYRDKKLETNEKGQWIEFLYRTVPYDTTVGTGDMPELNLHGAAHRLYTLGHDPILGWIFGTANILTDTATVSPGAIVQNNNKWAELIKIAGIRTYKVQRIPKLKILPEKVSMVAMFKDSYAVATEHPMNLPAAVFAEGQHLKSDANTKMGLPVPALEVFAPNFASKLYSNNYDALCFARDVKIVGKSATVSLLMDMLIGLIHGLYYDPQKDGSRDLYEVRTRKILLIANTIGTSSNLIFSYCTQNIKAVDIGGLLVTLSHLFTDTRFLLNVKKEFVENKLYEKIENEIKELNNIESELMEYGNKHRAIYD
ncbi:hypothetical protein MR730_09455 [bacterium]|nr:hypothetical protein [bacterium]